MYRVLVFQIRMLAAFIAAVGILGGTAALAAAPTIAPSESAARYYVLSFTGTPAAEAAEDVIVGALGQSVSIDSAVDALVTFQAEGWFSDRRLLEEFGAALMEGNAALVRRDAGLAIVPRADLSAEVLEGGELVATPGPAMPAAGRAPSAPAAYRPVVYGADRGALNWLTGVLIFAVGIGVGVAGLRGTQFVRARRAGAQVLIAVPGLRLVSGAPTATGEPGAEDAGLTIPPMPRARDAG